MCDATHHTRVRAVNWNFRRQHTLATKKKGTGDSIEKRSLMKCQQRQCSVSIK